MKCILEQTSFTDNDLYPEFCYMASRHDDIFRNFKRHPVYNVVLEHVTGEQGRDYLNIALSNPKFKPTEEQWRFFLRNDALGNPKTVTYNFGSSSLTCSPTTLRYLKCLSDLMAIFDMEKIKSVTEIGVGYGGLCRMIMHTYPNVETYNLVDLPEVLALAERFLERIDAPKKWGGVRYIDGTHLYHDVESDLIISNYAFSELVRNVQDFYLEKIVAKSKSGYVTWNNISFHVYGAYSLEEFLSKIPSAKILPEGPYKIDHCIVAWGDKIV